MTTTLDIRGENYGSIVLLRPLTETGREWLAANIAEDAQTLGEAIAVEPRYVGDILNGMAEAGLRFGFRSTLRFPVGDRRPT